MNTRLFCRLLASAIALSIVLLLPSRACADDGAGAAAPPPIGPEARERLAQAADDAQLAPWQREFMRGLASGEQSQLPERAQSADDGTWGPPTTLARYAHSAVYDPVRDRMLVFGGQDTRQYDEVWQLSLTGVPAWAQLTPAGSPPAARVYATVVYDPVRDRLILFGGFNSQYQEIYKDVWELSLSGSPVWTERTPTGAGPIERQLHNAIYDPVRDRMVIYGGIGMTHLEKRNDVWALSLTGTPAWTELMPSGTPPVPRISHSAIYDPLRDRMVVFGASDDVQALSLGGAPAWTPLAVTGTTPGQRLAPGAIYDPVRDRMLIFGGFDYGTNGDTNDVWALSLAGAPSWTALTPTGTAPSARHAQAAIYDPARDRMVVSGGFANGSPGYQHDVWTLKLAATPAWSKLTPSWPSGGRDLHSAILDPVRDRMIVFGGFDSFATTHDDTWYLSFSTLPAWKQITVIGPTARSAHSAIYDPVRDRMIVFGGGNEITGNRNDVWALSLAGTPAWSQLTPTGTPPSPRSEHRAIYDPVRHRMLVFGGGDGSLRNDVWALSLAGTPAWTQLTPTGTPPSPRKNHSLVYDPVRDRALMFGGWDGAARDDLWALSLGSAPAWTHIVPIWPTTAHQYHSAIYDPVRDRMLVYGGTADVQALLLSGSPAWTQLIPTGVTPVARSYHSAIYDPARDRMVIFGGAGPNYRDDVDLFYLTGVPSLAVPDAAPEAAGLRAPAPNPFTGSMSLRYALTRAGRLRIAVYDVSGRSVRTLLDEQRLAGEGVAAWDGADDAGRTLDTGIYFVRLTAPGVNATRRIVRLK